MTYVRKTVDTWVIQGNYGYGYGWEDLCVETSLRDARENLKLYRENEVGIPFRKVNRRERIENNG